MTHDRPKNLRIVPFHPNLADRLGIMRDKTTSDAAFRNALHEVSAFIATEATRDLRVERQKRETPLMETSTLVACGQDIVFVVILRAGLGMLRAMQKSVPGADVGFIAMTRDHITLQARRDYVKLPRLHGRRVIVLDPMLATGNSAVGALDIVWEHRPARVTFANVLCCKEGYTRILEAHPQTDVVTVCADERLNNKGYLEEGLGDAGDRQFGNHAS